MNSHYIAHHSGDKVAICRSVNSESLESNCTSEYLQYSPLVTEQVFAKEVGYRV